MKKLAVYFLIAVGVLATAMMVTTVVSNSTSVSVMAGGGDGND